MARQPKPGLRERALAAERESKYIEFKERFDPAEDGEWCELLKDFAALANSSGGAIVIGLRNDGSPSGADVQAVLQLDPAKITDKLFKYTGVNHDGFEIREGKRRRQRVAIVLVAGAAVPIVFTKPGTYKVVGAGKQQANAFSKGTVYFRHGAKSEPATSDDLQIFIERKVDEVWKSRAQNLRRLVSAPADAQVTISRLTTGKTTGAPPTVRVTTDPTAPVYGKLDPDVTHPYRQMDLITEVNRRLPTGTTINTHDVKCIRTILKLDGATAPEFCHRPKFGVTQYSQQFAEWLVAQHKKDPSFFANLRKRYHDIAKRS
jgi:Schlafen, AlbA_2